MEVGTVVEKRSKFKKLFIRAAVLVAVIGVGGFAAYTWVTLTFTYSSGERVGFVQKLSKRGWICKTIEGDLAMANVIGQPAQMFPFTVRDEQVAAAIDALAGHKVALKYEEHRGIPSSCFGDTSYFVVGVQKAE